MKLFANELKRYLTVRYLTFTCPKSTENAVKYVQR